MAVPTTIASLSTTAASNSPAGTDPKSQGDDNIRAAFAFTRWLSSVGSNVASATSLALPAAGSVFSVTGTTTVAGISSTNSWAGREVLFVIGGAQTWTHSSTLYFADLLSRTFAANDLVRAVDTDGAGTWKLFPFMGLPTMGAWTVGPSADPIVHVKNSSGTASDVRIGAASGLGFIGTVGAHDFFVQRNSSNYAQLTTAGLSVLVPMTTVQTMFEAHRASNQDSGGEVAMFDVEVTDVGTCYDDSTGTFTAPATGTYLFTYALCLQNTTGSAGAFVVGFSPNGSANLKAACRQHVDNNQAGAFTGSWIAALTAADTVEIYNPTEWSSTCTLISNAGAKASFCAYRLG